MRISDCGLDNQGRALHTTIESNRLTVIGVGGGWFAEYAVWQWFSGDPKGSAGRIRSAVSKVS